MARRTSSAVVTLRIPDDLDRRIAREARRRRCTKSELVREALEKAFGESSAAIDPAAEARRLSLLVSGRRSDAEALDFSVAAADTRGWR